MIFNIIFILLTLILDTLGILLPRVTLNDIWLIGEPLRETLISAVMTWNAFLLTFPYAELPWKLFIFFVIPFEIAIMLIRAIFGNRSPFAQKV